MTRQTTGGISLSLGFLALLVGFSLRFWPGGWLPKVLLVATIAVALLSGEWQALADPDIDAESQKTSRYWLLGGCIFLSLGGAILLLANNLN